MALSDNKFIFRACFVYDAALTDQVTFLDESLSHELVTLQNLEPFLYKPNLDSLMQFFAFDVETFRYDETHWMMKFFKVLNACWKIQLFDILI